MTTNTPQGRGKKSEPVSFRIEADLFEKLEAASWAEHRKRGELARLIFEWGFRQFQDAGSYDALIGRRSRR